MVYTPLTPEQFSAAKQAGFKPDQIIANEKRRKAESTQNPAENDGFLKTVAKGVITPFAKLGVGAYNAAQTAGSIATGSERPDPNTARKLPFLGDVKPYGQEGIMDPNANFPAQFGKNVMGTLGGGAEMASNFVGGSGAIGVAKAGLKGLVGQGAKTGFKTGIAGGGLYGLGSGLQKEDAGFGSVTGDALGGALLGGIGGGIIGGAVPIAGRALGIAGRKTGVIAPKAEPVAPVNAAPGSAQTREFAEATAPKPTIKEQMIGLRPDIKKRIQGKPDQVQKYINIAKTRNLDDTAPTPYSYGAQRVDEAQKLLEERLNDTGGEIGAFKKKLGSYTANVDDVFEIEDTFQKQLERLNLSMRDNAVSKIPGKIASVSPSEMKMLNEFHNDMQIVKQSPTIQNLFDLRNAFDKKINFGKQSREVSNIVDPLARQVRKMIADKAAKIVGKTEAGKLTDYSEYIDALEELKSYTERRAGGEYLIRVALSGRGAQSQKLLERIRKETGVDLMDDATMAKLATDMFGNDAQKNLLQQEITRAGMDASAFMRGDATGMLGAIYRRGVDLLTDEEQILMDAARGGLQAPPPLPSPTINQPKITPKLNKETQQEGRGVQKPNKYDNVSVKRITDKTRFERAKDLAKEDSAVEARAFDLITRNEDRILSEYMKKHNKIVNTDNFRPTFKGVGYDGSNSAAVQEPSSYLAKRARAIILDKNKDHGKFVTALSGGSGSGKTSAVNGIENAQRAMDNSALVVDSNLANYESAKKLISEAEAAGKKFRVIYTYRDAEDAMINGVVKRMKDNLEEMGRIVPSKVVAQNHIDSWDVAQRLYDDGHLVEFVDNSLGKDKAKLVTIDELAKKIQYPSQQKLQSVFNTALKKLHASGDLTDRQYEKYIN